MFKISLNKIGLLISLALLSTAAFADVTSNSIDEKMKKKLDTTIMAGEYSRIDPTVTGRKLTIRQGVFEKVSYRASSFALYYEDDDKATYAFDESWECALAGLSEVGDLEFVYLLPPGGEITIPAGTSGIPANYVSKNEPDTTYDWRGVKTWRLNVLKNYHASWQPTVAFSCWRYED